MGEVMMGHLRYGTHGKNNVFGVHPFIRENNWMTHNLVIAGNFNMVNNRDLFQQLVALGQHPKNSPIPSPCWKNSGISWTVKYSNCSISTNPITRTRRSVS